MHEKKVLVFCLNQMAQSPARTGIAALVLALLVAMSPLSGEAQAANLPPHEHFVYARTIGETKDVVDIDLMLRSDKKGAWYEYTSKASDEDAFFRLDPATFDVTWSDVTTKSPTVTLRRTTEVIENRAHPKPDELMISATGPFLQQIRLLPLSDKPKLRVSFLGSPGANGFSLELAVVGRESVTVAGKVWDCWKLQFGMSGVMGGVLGGLVGKSSYWYAVDWPNVLVRSSGPGSFPGSPITTLELRSYSAPTGPIAGKK
ncbi:MAG: hypothetical protein WCL50_10250 [Spirochaetota bacterium]